ncbi:MAG: tol-pal system YbgF family protein [Saprospiraceae bacterium]
MANEWNNRIEDYLDNLMNEEDKKSFEIEMQNNKALANQVAIVQEINHTIGLDGKFQEFQETINILNQKHFQTTTTSKQETVVRSINPQKRFLAIAAAIIVLVVSSVLIWNVLQSETANSSELFATNYEPYTIVQRSGNDNLTEVEKAAFENYNNGNFEAAIPSLEQLVEKNAAEENYIFLLGSAYLSTNQSEKAIVIFQNISESSLNYQAAQWYLALAYLQNNKIETAKVILTELAKGERTYSIKAKALLEEF